MTDFSSPQKLYMVLIPRNRNQRVASTVTRLLVRQARRLAIPTAANQAAQTELASLVPRLIASPGTRLEREAREILRVVYAYLYYTSIKFCDLIGRFQVFDFS